MEIWFKIWDNTHLLASETVEYLDGDTRTHKVFRAIEEACNRLDLGQPIWLDKNIEEFRRRSRTRFGRDNFMEEISFDYLEMQVLKEDDESRGR